MLLQIHSKVRTQILTNESFQMLYSEKKSFKNYLQVTDKLLSKIFSISTFYNFGSKLPKARKVIKKALI